MSRSHFLVQIFFGLFLVALVNTVAGEGGPKETSKETIALVEKNGHGDELTKDDTDSHMQPDPTMPSNPYVVHPIYIDLGTEDPHAVSIVELPTSTSSDTPGGVYSMDPKAPTMASTMMSSMDPTMPPTDHTIPSTDHTMPPTDHTMPPTAHTMPSTPHTTPIAATTQKPKSGSSALASSAIILLTMVILLRSV